MFPSPAQLNARNKSRNGEGLGPRLGNNYTRTRALEFWVPSGRETNNNEYNFGGSRRQLHQYSRVSIPLMSTMEYACKACGCIMSTKAKERRPLEGRPYSVLFEMASTCTEAPATAIHTVLAAAPSSVCKLCYSALTKYDAIKEQISKINSVLSSKLTTGPSTATTVS